MASTLKGRAPCPECGFTAAHIKESDKGTLYRYCPECGAQYHTKNERQRADLAAKLRPEGAPSATPSQAPTATATPSPAPTPSQPTANPNPPAEPAPKRKGLFA